MATAHGPPRAAQGRRKAARGPGPDGHGSRPTSGRRGRRRALGPNLGPVFEGRGPRAAVQLGGLKIGRRAHLGPPRRATEGLDLMARPSRAEDRADRPARRGGRPRAELMATAHGPPRAVLGGLNLGPPRGRAAEDRTSGRSSRAQGRAART